jgi:hypothetical protein
MKHQVLLEPSQGILYLKLADKLSDRDYDELADQVNRVLAKNCCKIFIDASEFSVDNSSDASRFSQKVQLNDCRAAVVNGLHKLKSYRKKILEMFAGDYEVAFFESAEDALRWLGDLDDSDCG